jgi:hypothetical protein
VVRLWGLSAAQRLHKGFHHQLRGDGQVATHPPHEEGRGMYLAALHSGGIRITH